MNKVPMTLTGSEQLKAELQQLKSVERPQIIEAIAEARAHGDLKENAEYHAAKEKQGFVEGRIAEVESKLSMAQVIDVAKLPRDNKVVFGTTVSLINLEDESTVTYQIVGDDESDIKQNKISVNSPIARAIIGKFAGDEVVVTAPGGEIEYEVDSINYL